MGLYKRFFKRFFAETEFSPDCAVRFTGAVSYDYCIYIRMYDLAAVSSSRSTGCDFTGHLYLNRSTFCLVADEVAVLKIKRCTVQKKV